MKYEDVLKRFVSNQAQLLQEKQMKQQLKEQMLSAKAQELRSFIPGMQGHSPEEEYTESEHNPFEEGQEFKAGGIHIDPSKKGTFKAQATRMGMSIQEAASHILNNKEKYSPAMVKKANFAKNFAKEEGGMFTGDYEEYGKGGMKTHKSEDGTITNTITKPNGDVVIQVKTKDGNYYEKLIKKSDVLDTLSKLQGAVSPEFQALSTAKTNTEKQEKEVKQKFLKEAWSDYDKWSTIDKASDRVGAFLNDPFGMTSRALLGEQAYIPGMAQGLHNHEDPEVRNMYLKELGYTPGEFDASDVQNMINPGYWASSLVDNVEKGNYGEAGLEAVLMGLPHLPKGTVSASNIKSGANMLKNDVKNASEYLTTKTPLKNAYRVNPWAFKPNPESYYRMGEGRKFIDDVLETNKIRAYNENSYANLRDAGKISGIREDGKIVLKAKTFPESDTYWSKGVPLDGRYASQNYGNYMIEASNDIPFIHSVNQRTKQKGFREAPDVNYNSTHSKGTYVKPRQSYGYNIEGNIEPSIGTPLEYNSDLIKLYEPHWLKGYKEVPKQLPGSPNAISRDNVVKAGLDGNFLTRPLTLFTKNEMLGTPDKKMLYRKIGNAKGLQDLIEKQGAQAPAPMRMTSGATIDTPFFGSGTKPNENYRGMFAVEVDPSNPKYRWSNNVGGVSNYGVAPYNPETGELVKNIPLEDLNVYKKKWFSNNYKKLKPEELKAALTFAREQSLIENLYKWGVRGAAADQIFNDGDYRKAIQEYFLGESNNNSENFQRGGMKTHKSKNGTITNRFMNKNGDTVVQVKTKDGEYYEKVIKAVDTHKTLGSLQQAVTPEFKALSYQEPTLEERVNYNLDNPQRKARNIAHYYAEEGEDDIDNIRHPFAGRYTAEALYKMRKKDTPWAPDWMNKGAAWLDANMLGVAHEAGTILRDERPWNIKLREAAEDIYNNGAGINVGLSDRTARQKTDHLLDKAYNFELPDGRGEEHPFRNSWVDPYTKKEGGGEMIKRADGSYSRRGLWDNIRDNRGSGKKPTKEMLEQERKIRREYATGGSFNNPGFNALPEAVQDKIIAAMMYGGNIDNNIWY